MGWVVVGPELSVEAPSCEARRSLRVTPTPGSFVAAIRGLPFSLSRPGVESRANIQSTFREFYLILVASQGCPLLGGAICPNVVSGVVGGDPSPAEGGDTPSFPAPSPPPAPTSGASSPSPAGVGMGPPRDCSGPASSSTTACLGCGAKGLGPRV